MIYSCRFLDPEAVAVPGCSAESQSCLHQERAEGLSENWYKFRGADNQKSTNIALAIIYNTYMYMYKWNS